MNKARFVLALLVTAGCSGPVSTQNQALGGLGQAPRSDGTCDAGLTVCANVCRDLTSDDANCGACTSACAMPSHCVKSACASANDLTMSLPDLAMPDLSTSSSACACTVAGQTYAAGMGSDACNLCEPGISASSLTAMSGIACDTHFSPPSYCASGACRMLDYTKLNPNHCHLLFQGNNTVVAGGEADPSNACRTCQLVSNGTGLDWVNLPDGTSCAQCGQCNAGTCTGSAADAGTPPDLSIAVTPDLVMTPMDSSVITKPDDLVMSSLPDLAAASVDMSATHDLAAPPADLTVGGAQDLALAPASFKTVGNFAVGSEPVHVAIADLNGDGKPDVISVNATSTDVSILNGDGTGSLAKAVAYKVAPGTQQWGPNHVLPVDVDGDGHLDLIVSNSFAGNGAVLQWSKSYALGNFLPGKSFAIAAGHFGTSGHVDLAMVTVGGLVVAAGAGDGTFTQSASYSGGGVHGIAVDLNGDNHTDIVIANNTLTNTGTAVGVYLGNGTGGFGAFQTFTTDIGPRSVDAGDVDGDGKLDVVVASSGGLSVLLGHGDGTLGASKLYPVNSGTPAKWVVLADVNHDGKLDAAVVNSSAGSGRVDILLGDGHGSFSASSSFTGEGVPQCVATGDLNGDGKPDFVTANFSSTVNSVTVFLNTTP